MTRTNSIRFQAILRSVLRQAIISAGAVIFALIVGMVIIYIMGINPFAAMKALFIGALGSKNAIGETLIKMAPLIFTGLSYSIANRCGLTNIGMEGQLYMGALFATIAGVYFIGLPAPLHIFSALAFGFVGGGIWGFIPGILKVRFGSSEIISTVMLNFIAVNFVQFMVLGPIAEPPGQMSQSYPILDSSKLPIILPGTRLHFGILVALFFVFLYWVFMWKSKKGYEIRLSGQNINAARYSGININRNIILIMIIAGGVAGLAGANEILGIQGRLLKSVSPGYGFDGIAVALIGMNSPIGIVIGAFLFGVLRSGGNAMQMATKVPVSIIYVIQAIVIITVCATQLFIKVKPKLNKKPETVAAEPN